MSQGRKEQHHPCKSLELEPNVKGDLTTLPEDLNQRSFDGSGRFFAFLLRERGTDRQTDARSGLGHFVAPEPLCPSDQNTLSKDVVHNLLQQLLLRVDIEHWWIPRED